MVLGQAARVIAQVQATRGLGALSWILLAVLGVLAGCGRGPAPASAVADLARARQAYERGEPADAVALADEFLRHWPASDQAARAHYLRGLAQLSLGDEAGAQADLEQTVERADAPALAGRAWLALGALADDRHDEPAAERAYRAALAALPADAPPADEALARLAGTLQRTGQWTQADILYDRLLYRWPDSAHAQAARRRIRARAWTVQLGSFDEAWLARRRRDELAGLEARVEPVGTEAVRYAVHLGRYDSCAAARTARDALAPQVSDAAIVPVR